MKYYAGSENISASRCALHTEITGDNTTIDIGSHTRAECACDAGYSAHEAACQ